MNTFHSRRRSSNTRIKLKSKEYLELEKSLNTENKLELNKFQDKSPSLTIMLLNILDNIFLNIFQKNKLNTLPRKEKLKNTNIFQSKDKLFTTLKLLLKLKSMLPAQLVMALLAVLTLPELHTLPEVHTLLEVHIILDILLAILLQPQFMVKLLHILLVLQLATLLEVHIQLTL